MQIEINEEALTYLKGLKSKKKQRKFLLDCMIEQITIGELAKFEETELVKYRNGIYRNGSSIIEGSVIGKNETIILYSVDKSKFCKFLVADNKSDYKLICHSSINPFKDNDIVLVYYPQDDNNLSNKTYSESQAVTLDKEKAINFDELEENTLKEMGLKKLITPYGIFYCKRFVSKSAKSNYSPEEIDIIKSGIKERVELLKFDQIDKNDMRLAREHAFNSARETHHEIVDGALKNKQIYDTFDDYFKTLKNE